MWSGYRGADQSSPGRRGSTRKIIVILNHFTVVFRGTIKVQLSEYSPGGGDSSVVRAPDS